MLISTTDSQVRSLARRVLKVIGGVVVTLPLVVTNCCFAGRGICPEPPEFSSPPSAFPKPVTLVRPTENFSSRGQSTTIDSVVLHTTEGSLQGTLNWFQSSTSFVSSHFVVASTGTIYQMVDTEDRAWHATYYNSRSIGIEMVGFAADPATWNDKNLTALADLLAWIVSAYPDIPLVHPGGTAYNFPNERYSQAGLVAHSQVQPWNRADPGIFFPWDDVIEAVEERLASVPEPAALHLLVCCGVGLITCRRRRVVTFREDDWPDA